MKFPSAPQSRRTGASTILLFTVDLLSIGRVITKAIPLCDSNTVDEMSSESDVETDRFIENPVPFLPSPQPSCLLSYCPWVSVPRCLLLLLRLLLRVSSCSCSYSCRILICARFCGS